MLHFIHLYIIPITVFILSFLISDGHGIEAATGAERPTTSVTAERKKRPAENRGTENHHNLARFISSFKLCLNFNRQTMVTKINLIMITN